MKSESAECVNIKLQQIKWTIYWTHWRVWCHHVIILKSSASHFMFLIQLSSSYMCWTLQTVRFFKECKLVNSLHDKANKLTITDLCFSFLNNKEEAYRSFCIHLKKCCSSLKFINNMYVNHFNTFVYNYILFIIVAQFSHNQWYEFAEI